MKSFTSVWICFLLFCTKSATCQVSGIVNEYRKVVAIDTAKGIIKLANAGAMTQYIGRTAMLIQMKGATIRESQDATFGLILSSNHAGNFEFGVLCGQQNDTLVFENKLRNFYDPNDLVQLVVLPRYSSVKITDTIKALPWDPVAGIGGVIALEATDTIYLNAPINADGAGFRGGALVNHNGDCADFSFPPGYNCTEYYLPVTQSNSYKHGGKKGEGIAEYISAKEYAKGRQSNGGGGGNNSNNGGGGGANYGAGGTGGRKTTTPCVNPNPGIGGQDLTAYGYSAGQQKIYLGGGGGAGHQNNNVGTPGGNGGGIVYIKSKVLITDIHRITANGTKPYKAGLYNGGTDAGGDGGGGGGAGGSIILNVTSTIGNLLIDAKGGAGSSTSADSGACAGPGGGGGGGLVWLRTSSTPANFYINTNGGVNGIAFKCNSSNNATTGVNGGTIYNFILPPARDTSPICKSILSQSPVAAFKGHEERNSRVLTLTLSSTGSISKLMLQRSLDGVSFIDLASQRLSNTLVYKFTDLMLQSKVYYRVQLTTTSGLLYTQVVSFRNGSNDFQNLSIFPNPAHQRLSFTISVKERQIVNASIIDHSGRLATSVRMILHPLVEQYALPLNDLPAGSYQLLLSGERIKVSRRFTKL
jgi:hypothetical protein